MKRMLFLAIIPSLCFFSCSKNDNPDPAPLVAYMNMKTGSVWNYQTTNNEPPPSTSSYSVISTNKDTTINNNSFHVYSNASTGASSYFRISASDYFTFQALPAELGGTMVENLYLKASAAVNTSWVQNYNITYSGLPLALTLTNKIVEKDISRTVNAKNYANVIHVSTSISIAGVPASSLTTDIQYYYAPGYGMIENTSDIHLNYIGIVGNSNVSTTLQSAILAP